jgi:hypothetical protein
MSDAHLYTLLSELPPRGQELLNHLAARSTRFGLRDVDLPPGGVSAWAADFERLVQIGALERAGWGQSPRFRLTADARQAWRQLVQTRR